MRPGFENDVAERFIPRRADKQIGQFIVKMRVQLPADPPHLIGDAELMGMATQLGIQWAIADDDEMQRSVIQAIAQQRQRRQQILEALDRM